RQPFQRQLTERRVLLEPARFTLANLNLDDRLLVVGRRKEAGLLGWGVRVALGQRLPIAAQRAHPHRPRPHLRQHPTPPPRPPGPMTSCMSAAAWMAAPTATPSSGLMSMRASRP